MSATQSAPGRTRRHTATVPASVMTLAGLLGFLIIGALQGGWAMVTNPVNPLGMSPDFLEKAPIADYFWPGVFLLAIAGASILTVPGLLFGWKWRWAARIEAAVGYRWPWIASISIGSILLVFELIELFMVPFHPIMHPLLIVGSAAIALLPLTPSARAELKPR